MQEFEFNDTIVRQKFLDTPFRGLLIGPSRSGKSEFLYELIKNFDKIYETENYFTTVRYFYTAWNEKYTRLMSAYPNIVFEQGPPTPLVQELLSTQDKSLITAREMWVLDDHLEVLLSPDGELISQIYTKSV